MTPLENAKDLILIPQLASLRGWAWKPGKICRIPYRADAHPSGSVFADGKLFHDYTTGENLDAPALLAAIERISNKAACEILIQLAGDRFPASRDRSADRLEQQVRKPRCKPTLPIRVAPGPADSRRIAKLRNIGVEAVEIAASRGFLFISMSRGLRCWGLTDSTGWACQLRRLDGLLFGGGARPLFKAWTTPGSYGNWPLGCAEARLFDRIAFVEGGGDFLGALHFAVVENCSDCVAPVAMLGASTRIAPEALPYFQGKRVRIFAHVDPPSAVNSSCAGLEAAARWQTQLSNAGAKVDCVDLSGLRKSDGSTVTDLNDLTSIDVDDFESERVLHALMDF